MRVCGRALSAQQGEPVQVIDEPRLPGQVPEIDLSVACLKGER